MLPDVLVLTNEHDFGADDVIRRLSERGAAVRRLNAEDAAGGPVAPWSPDAPDAWPAQAVWWRQFEIPEPEDRSSEKLDEVLVLRLQWRTWLSTISTDRARWINHLWPARRAEHKPLQMRVAVDAGFRLPPSIVTNSREDAAAFARTHGGCVVKSLAPAYFDLSDRAFVYSTSLEEALDYRPEAWHSQPVIVQKWIHGDDVRVVAVGDEFRAARTSTPVLDWRTDPRRLKWTEAPAPSGFQRSARAYLGALELVYGAFDFVDDGRTCWFLEANQAGEFNFLDRQAGLGISQLLADALLLRARGVT